MTCLSEELDAMQSLYDKDGFGMMVIYGRRRIGKSTLINEFIKNKNAIFYTATKVGQNRNLELFAKQVISVLDPDFESASFPSTEDIFNFITKKLPDKKIVLVIDELPYWAEKDDSLLSILQKYIDTEWQNKNLFIILCGSALSFMEKKVLSEKSPLFGRRDSQIKLEAFNYKDSALFVPDYSFEEKAICYGITGGVAKYLSMIDKTKTLDENIKHLFFHTDGYLYDETRNLLTQEFMDIALVNNIIEQIASGQNTINLISEKVKEKASTVLYSIDKLMEVGLIEKKNCIKTAVVGECKFKNEPIGKEIYDTLLRRSKLISGKYRISKYLLFSLSGYTSWFDELNDGNLRMFTLAELYE